MFDRSPTEPNHKNYHLRCLGIRQCPDACWLRLDGPGRRQQLRNSCALADWNVFRFHSADSTLLRSQKPTLYGYLIENISLIITVTIKHQLANLLSLIRVRIVKAFLFNRQFSSIRLPPATMFRTYVLLRSKPKRVIAAPSSLIKT